MNKECPEDAEIYERATRYNYNSVEKQARLSDHQICASYLNDFGLLLIKRNKHSHFINLRMELC